MLGGGQLPLPLVEWAKQPVLVDPGTILALRMFAVWLFGARPGERRPEQEPTKGYTHDQPRSTRNK